MRLRALAGMAARAVGLTLTPTTWNPSDKDASLALSNGNLTVTDTNTVAFNLVRSIVGVSSGKWYWEITAGTSDAGSTMVGVSNSSQATNNYIGSTANSWGYVSNATKENGSGGSAYGASWTAGDVIGVALDMDAGTLTFYKNGVSQGQAFSGITGTIYAGWSCIISGNNATANFGATAFAHSVPSGFTPGLGTLA